MNLSRETLSSEAVIRKREQSQSGVQFIDDGREDLQDVCVAGIGQLGETGLLLDVESYVLQVCFRD